MDNDFNILIIDDEDGIRKTLSILLRANHFQSDEAKSGMEAIEKMHQNEYQLIITDLRMNDVDGWEILEKGLQIQSNVEIIVITAFANIEDGVRAIKSGAYDFLEKPIESTKFIKMVKQIAEKRRLENENERLKALLKEQSAFDGIIGNSTAMHNVLRMITQISHADSSVLITGESGTGKELVARAIYASSPRKRKNFVAINCGALPETLQESELFGHVKGSFTGAHHDNPGLFSEADGGTIFLDEIAELSLTAQVKLLRFLQDGEIRRVGDSKPFHINARVIAATNKNLLEEIAKNKFRDDLFYRLNVIPIHLPPLRERGDDVTLMANYFLQKYAKKFNKNVQSISKRAGNILNHYTWPGNVRELQNIIERAVVLCNGKEIKPSSLPTHIVNKVPSVSNKTIGSDITLEELERNHIMAIYKRYNGNKKAMMDVLQVPKTTLWRKLKEYSIEPNPL